jgi:hypothetical protein
MITAVVGPLGYVVEKTQVWPSCRLVERYGEKGCYDVLLTMIKLFLGITKVKNSFIYLSESEKNF